MSSRSLCKRVKEPFVKTKSKIRKGWANFPRGAEGVAPGGLMSRAPNVKLNTILSIAYFKQSEFDHSLAVDVLNYLRSILLKLMLSVFFFTWTYLLVFSFFLSKSAVETGFIKHPSFSKWSSIDSSSIIFRNNSTGGYYAKINLMRWGGDIRHFAHSFFPLAGKRKENTSGR